MKKPSKSFREGLKNSRDFLRYTNVAARMILIILAGVFAGVKIDEYLNMGFSLFTLLFTLASVGGAMYMIIREFTSK